MAIQSFVSFTLLLLIDFRIFSKIRYYVQYIFQANKTYLPVQTNNALSSIAIVDESIQISNVNLEDDDVKAESDRIRGTSYDELMSTDVMVLNQVEKVYHGSFHAVDQISVGVKHGECFGLLGVNGA